MIRVFCLVLWLIASQNAVVATEPDWSQIESIVQAGIEAGEMPGAIVVIASRNEVLYRKAFGFRQIEPTRERMTVDTVFDMASITKPVATATSVMILVQRGLVDVDKPVSQYLPEFGAAGKSKITVADLLLHVGGLIPDNALKDYQDGIERSWQNIWALKPRSVRREKFVYTDVGFLVLGKLVERVSGQSLDVFADENIFQPLKMTDSSYRPSAELVPRIAPTEKRNDKWIRGEVHDPRAFLLDGVAGHAGLFSTADDMVRYGQMMLGRGSLGSVEILKPEIFEVMTRPRAIPRGTRTFGWDHQSPYSRNRGTSFSDAAFGHGGFTGTVFWVDPKQDRVFIFLSNRLHPDGRGTVNGLAGQIATLIGQER
ncbi:MAG: serine hydrolase domain-containing protein [Planctomycetota bacterium]